MTKDELVAAMDGLAGNTEILLWDEHAGRFFDIEAWAEIRLNTDLTEADPGYPGSFWIRAAVRQPIDVATPERSAAE